MSAKKNRKQHQPRTNTMLAPWREGVPYSRCVKGSFNNNADWWKGAKIGQKKTTWNGNHRNDRGSTLWQFKLLSQRHNWIFYTMKGLRWISSLLLAALCCSETVAFAPMSTSAKSTTSTALSVFGTKEKTEKTEAPEASVEETTEKYGLEAGLFKSLQSNDGGESAKSLLKKYGIAYLATSIPLALVSFGICYVLVDNGVDVASLLSKVGIQSGDATEKAGTFAIAYAAHKAASPIRFPPTVILTPVVAKLIGKEPEEMEEEGASP